MAIKIGINGFGRIGRIIFRTCFPNTDIVVSAINDPAIDIEYICYLIKFDSTHGKFKEDISYSEDEINIKGSKIKVFGEKIPSRIRWDTIGVQYVVEASGMFATLDKASGHLARNSVKRVIVTAPSVDIPMMIIGINEDRIKKEYKVISCASSTLYCLAPIIKLLDDNFGLSEGYMTSIHAMTPSLKPLDGLCLRGKHWRDHRSIHQNIIPAATGACRALGKIIPRVKDKMCGLAFRVPIVNVSVLDISIRLETNTSLQEIVQKINLESVGKMKNIIRTSYEETVSSDFLNDKHSCILDVYSSLQLSPKSFKLICWYENEYTYACRVLDTIMFSEEQLKVSESPKSTFERPIVRSIPKFCHIISAVDKGQNVLNNLKFENNLSLFKKCQGQSLQEKLNCPKDISNKRFCKSENSNFTANIHLRCNGPILKLPNFSSAERYYIKEKQERLEYVKKSLAEVAEQTENLLKQSNHDKLESSAKKAITNERSKEARASNFSDCIDDIINNMALSREDIEIKEKIFDSKEVLNNSDISLSSDCDKKGETTTDTDRKNAIAQKNETVNYLIEYNPKQNDNTNIAKVDSNDNNVIIDKATPKILEKKVTVISNDKTNSVQTPNETPTTTKKMQLGNNQHNKCKAIINNYVYETSNCCSTTKAPTKNILNLKQPDNATNVSVRQDTNYENSKNTKDTTTSKIFKRKFLESIIKKISKESNTSVSEESSRISVDKITKICYRHPYTNKLDLFDKLDSETDTDSENPSPIYDTKSQVLDITDLTNSVEDIARLDKICRIIEISDELSDQLFSVLNNSTSETNLKKWSFKDLCERIQLDEFCDKLFGQCAFKKN